MNNSLAEMYRRKPLIVAHRGASAYRPANTLVAFEYAVELGADGIELDVHRSKDGYPVVMHDFTVDSTTDGTGTVSDMTLAELKTLDAGVKFASAYSGARIPTLDEVFEAVGARLYVNVEIKSMAQDTDGVEAVVADCIARHSMAARVIVSSFNPLALHRFRAIMPDVAIGFLHHSDIPFDTWAMVESLGLTYEARHPHFHEMDAAYMEAARAAGHRVNVWTVNDPAEAKRLAELGVDAIITDAPDIIRQAVQVRE